MAEVTNMPPCRFKWNIFNPFLHLRPLEAIFYYGSRTPTRWSVIVLPTMTGFNSWALLFSLRCIEFGESDTIIAERLKVNISIDGQEVVERRENVYTFRKNNQSLFIVFASVQPDPDKLDQKTDHLIIVVEMSLPGQNIATQEENGLVFSFHDLLELSQNLSDLLGDFLYSDIRLNSKESFSYAAHSSIMSVRWSNFLVEHREEIARGTDYPVQTNYEMFFLGRVLFYMYTGYNFMDIYEFPFEERDASLLFKLIDKYDLHHLYKFFVHEDSQQERCTRRNVNKTTISFPLDDPAICKPLRNPTFKWNINPNSRFDFVFRIKLLLSADPPIFKYKLRSKYQYGSRFIRVILIFAKTGGVQDIFRPMHDHDYVVDPDGTVLSGICHFEGGLQAHPELIEYRESWDLEERSYRHSVICIFSFSDGTTSLKLQQGIQGNFPSEEERYEVLSNHMSKLLEHSYEPDLEVKCRSEIFNTLQIYPIHKAIFITRVTNWTAVILEDISEGGEIPGEVSCILSSEAFCFVLRYIYTGKMLPIPNQYLDEIENFAVLGEIQSLESMVNGMRIARNL